MKNLPKDLSQVQDQINNLNNLLRPIQSIKESNSGFSINTAMTSQNSDKIENIKLNGLRGSGFGSPTWRHDIVLWM
jgi:hypothetical protein